MGVGNRRELWIGRQVHKFTGWKGKGKECGKVRGREGRGRGRKRGGIGTRTDRVETEKEKWLLVALQPVLRA